MMRDMPTADQLAAAAAAVDDPKCAALHAAWMRAKHNRVHGIGAGGPRAAELAELAARDIFRKAVSEFVAEYLAESESV